MDEKAIKNELDNFDIDLLNCMERLDYNRYIREFPKRLTLLKVMDRNKDNLSYDLEQIYFLIEENEKGQDLTI